jgi:hypothetical protein
MVGLIAGFDSLQDEGALRIERAPHRVHRGRAHEQRADGLPGFDARAGHRHVAALTIAQTGVGEFG